LGCFAWNYNTLNDGFTTPPEERNRIWLDAQGLKPARRTVEAAVRKPKKQIVVEERYASQEPLKGLPIYRHERNQAEDGSWSEDKYHLAYILDQRGLPSYRYARKVGEKKWSVYKLTAEQFQGTTTINEDKTVLIEERLGTVASAGIVEERGEVTARLETRGDYIYKITKQCIYKMRSAAPDIVIASLTHDSLPGQRENIMYSFGRRAGKYCVEHGLHSPFNGKGVTAGDFFVYAGAEDENPIYQTAGFYIDADTGIVKERESGPKGIMYRYFTIGDRYYTMHGKVSPEVMGKTKDIKAGDCFVSATKNGKAIQKIAGMIVDFDDEGVPHIKGEGTVVEEYRYDEQGRLISVKNNITQEKSLYTYPDQVSPQPSHMIVTNTQGLTVSEINYRYFPEGKSVTIDGNEIDLPKGSQLIERTIYDPYSAIPINREQAYLDSRDSMIHKKIIDVRYGVNTVMYRNPVTQQYEETRTKGGIVIYKAKYSLAWNLLGEWNWDGSWRTFSYSGPVDRLFTVKEEGLDAHGRKYIRISRLDQNNRTYDTKKTIQDTSAVIEDVRTEVVESAGEVTIPEAYMALLNDDMKPAQGKVTVPQGAIVKTISRNEPYLSQELPNSEYYISTSDDIFLFKIERWADGKVVLYQRTRQKFNGAERDIIIKTARNKSRVWHERYNAETWKLIDSEYKNGTITVKNYQSTEVADHPVPLIDDDTFRLAKGHLHKSEYFDAEGKMLYTTTLISTEKGIYIYGIKQAPDGSVIWERKTKPYQEGVLDIPTAILIPSQARYVESFETLPDGSRMTVREIVDASDKMVYKIIDEPTLKRRTIYAFNVKTSTVEETVTVSGGLAHTKRYFLIRSQDILK
ncbi:MAG: hypothetical protein PHS37_10265, partial [Candidatus Omnitrophica bacterium]|nr:hypothetical protein [Candidatus Omnitrophota bacterium]